MHNAWAKSARFAFAVLSLSSFVLTLTASSWACASALAPTFTYQGRFFTPDGTQPMTDTVDVTLGIYSPDGSCLLYEEKQLNIDLATNPGLFALKVGSLLGDPKRTARDPGKGLALIFANATSAIRADDVGTTATCIGGYTPLTGDNRRLKVTIYSHSTTITETLSPDLTFSPVPMATVAETLQGLGADAFIQASTNITQATLGTLTSCAAGGACMAVAADASGLHHHDSLYTRMGSSTPQNLGTGGTYTSGTVGAGTATAPTGVQMEVKAASSSTKGITIQGATGQAVNYFEIKDSSGNVLFAFDKDGKLSTSGQFSSVNGATIGYPLGTAGPVNGLAVSGNVGIGTTGPLAKLTVVGTGAASTQFRSEYSNSNTVLTGAGSAVTLVNTDPTNGAFAGIDFRSLNSSASEVISSKILGVFASRTATQVSGDLAFMTRDTSGTLAERVRILGSGNVGIGTSSPLAKLHIDNVSESTQGFLLKTNYNAGVTNGDIFKIQDSLSRDAVKFGVNNDAGYFRVQYVTGSSYLSSSVANGSPSLLLLRSGTDRDIAINLNTTSGTNWALGSFSTDATSNFSITSGGLSGTKRLTIDTSGNVGIGAATPGANLEISGSVHPSLKMTSTSGAAYNTVFENNYTSANPFNIKWNGTKVLTTENSAYQTFLDTVNNAAAGSGLRVGGTTALYAQHGGNIGIGTTGPDSRLQISGTYDAISVNATGATINPTLRTGSTNGLNHAGLLVTPTFSTLNSNVANAYGIKTSPTHTGSYTTTNAYGLYVDAPTVTSGAITNNFAASFNGGDVVMSNGNVTIRNTIPATSAVAQSSSKLLLEGRSWSSTLGDRAVGAYFQVNNTTNNANPTVDRLGLFVGSAGVAATEKMSISSAGNVGIGTTNPGQPLDVVGTIRTSGSVVVDAQTGSANGTLALVGRNASVASNAYVSANYNGGLTMVPAAADPTVTIGGASPSNGNTLSVIGKAAIGDTAFVSSAAPANGLIVKGVIGVGTTGPAYALHVAYSDPSVYASSSSASVTPFSYQAAANVLVQNTTGTDGSAAYLTLQTKNTSGTNNYGYIGGVATAGSPSPSIVFGQRTGTTAYAERMRIDPAGNVGIGTTGPSYKLQVGDAADGTEARANAWNTLSDERLKRDFSAIDDSLEKILQIGGYTYYWKNSPDKARKMGVKAQEVERVFPEVVSTGSDGYKSVSYNHLIAPVIEAIKSLATKWSNDHGELEALKVRFDGLKSENEAIKTWACSQSQAKDKTQNRRPAFCQ